ncbi:MAG: hypothetical protein AAF799_03465 [Myxococcota bacterium]
MRAAKHRGPWLGLRVAPWLLVLAAAMVASNVSCFLQLDDDIACGDGYVDVNEDCDPANSDSLNEPCRNLGRPEGHAACDPTTCRFVSTPVTLADCAVCGDGFIDPQADEECEGNDIGGAVCPSGVGFMQCSDCVLDDSRCAACGNGDRDEGEECDPNDIDDLSVVRNCVDLPPLGNTGRTYAGGSYSRCLEDCRYNREACNFCGNGVLDGAVSLDDRNNESLPEWCDGGVFNDARVLEALPKSVCYDNPEDGLRPIVGCSPGCRGFEERTDIEQLCCRKKGEDCPLPGSGIACCFEVDNPDSPGPYCQDVYVSPDDPMPRSVCR